MLERIWDEGRGGMEGRGGVGVGRERNRGGIDG